MSKHYKRYTLDEILEAKNYYYDGALTEPNEKKKSDAIEFLKYFNIFYDIQEGASLDEYLRDGNQYLWLRNNLNRVEMKIECYFNMKAKGRL